MSDSNPHHPGVRSLLAKFEGQSPITSPPSRGRSPAASDTSGTARQLSRVRASFVNVEGALQSNPASPLRKTSGRSDSPGIFGPKINSEDVESSRQDMASPTPASAVEHPQNATLAQVMAEGRPETIAMKPQQNNTTQEPAARSETAPQSQDAPKTGPASKSRSTVSETPSQKPDASIKRKPSTVGTTANKPSNTSTSKPQSGASKPSAREVAKERSNALAHKPSRVSLNPKTAPRPVRGATPVESPKSSTTTSRATRQSTASMQPPPKPASTGTSTRTANTLTRKPSTLRSAAGAQPHATPSTSVRRQSSRASLPAPPANERPSSRTSDVHATKPVNEGFLARMMRPTASSANKFHEKTDTKPVSKTTSASKAPRQSIGGRVPERAASQSKPKTTLRPQSEKSQAANKAPVRDHQPPQKKQESEKENIVEPTPTSPKEPVTVEKTYVAAVEQPQAVAKPAEEVSAPIQTGKLIEEATSTIEPLKKSAEVSESVIEAPLEPIKSEGKDETEAEVEVPVELQPVAEAEAAIQAEVEASAGTIEPIPETGEEEKSVETSATPGVADTTPAQADETVDEPKTSAPAEVEVAEQQNVASEPEFEAPSDSKVEVSEKDETIPAKDITIPETSAEPEEQVAEKTAEEKPTEVRPATEAESSNVALDITTLALN